MQHKYVGGIGDYVKFALLRQLEPGHRIGVVWWLFPDELAKGDGRHIPYLDNAEWRRYDPGLFDELSRIVKSGRRNVGSLQSAEILQNALFVDTEVPVKTADRERWIIAAKRDLSECDLVFLDPDNGLEPRTFAYGRKAAGKSIAYSELQAFKAPGRTLVVYHHQTRAKGGHLEEIRTIEDRLNQTFDRVDAIRATPYSPRVFFLLDASDELLGRAEELCDWWGGKMSLNPHRTG